MNKIKVLLLVIVLYPFSVITAQNDDIAAKIKGHLSAKDGKKIAKADKLYTSYRSDKEQAEKMEGSGRKKSLKMQISASKSFGKANKICYKIYRKDLKNFEGIDNNDSARIIKKRLTRAKRIMRLTSQKRETALKLTSNDNIYSVLKHADELEEKAFKDLFYIYSLLLIGDSPVEKPEEKSNKDEILNVNYQGKENIPNEKIANENKISLPENESLKAVDNQTNPAGLKQGQKNESEKLVSNEEGNYSGNEEIINSNVYFKIQVAASKTQIAVDQLIRNFPTQEVLNVEIDGDWYKYSVRKKFVSYNEALQYKDNLNIKGAFILAYKNGNRVSIEEAQKKDDDAVVKSENRDSPPLVNGKPENSGKITYRLQVGFSTNRLGVAEIAKFKNGGKEVIIIDCGSWFIYTVGEFETESEAVKFQKIKGLSEADLIKFRNGKPLEE